MSVRRLPSGKWLSEVGSGAMGTRKTKTFIRKFDADKWYMEKRVAMATSANSDGPNLYLRVEDILDRYLISKNETSEKYRASIKSSIMQVCQLLSIEFLKDITAEKMERFKSSSLTSSNHTLKSQPVVSKYTQQLKLKYMKALCEWMRKNGWLAENPIRDVDNLKFKRNKRRALDETEVKLLLEHLHKKSPRLWFPLVFTAINTGLRKAELVTLEWEDVDFERNIIQIKNKPHLLIEGRPHQCKWGSSRIIPLRKSLRDLFQSLVRHPTSNLIFPTEAGRIRWNNWDRRLRPLLSSAPIRNTDEISFHVFRHTFISQLLAYGKQDIKTVSHLAGHSNLTTTQNYVHLLGSSQMNMTAVESLPDYSIDLQDGRKTDE